MSKPVYKHPEFVTEVTLTVNAGNRYWLNLEIDKSKNESILVILKNPSRATKDISSKTVYTVTKYIYKNRDKFQELKNIGNVIILNLMPPYETYSKNLKLKIKEAIDEKNFETISDFCKKHKKVIVAWGNHPKHLSKEYKVLVEKARNILMENKNEVFYVDSLSKAGNPKHGQVWGYKNELLKYFNS